MGFISTPVQLTALRQLAHLTIDQRTSAPAIALGHLAVQTPDEGGQISAAWACLPDTRFDTGPQPPTGRTLVALLRRGTRPTARGSSSISTGPGDPRRRRNSLERMTVG